MPEEMPAINQATPDHDQPYEVIDRQEVIDLIRLVYLRYHDTALSEAAGNICAELENKIRKLTAWIVFD